MNRLFLLLAASVLGTGCMDICDARTVSVGWPSFQLADGTVTSSCTQAHVSTVNIYLDGQAVTSLPCDSGGVDVDGVPNDGDHLFTVEAIDTTTGGITFRDQVDVSDSNCRNLLEDTQPSQGTFVLNFSLSPNLCASATDSYIWFTIMDDIANQTIAVDGSDTPQAWPCGGGTSTTPVAPSFPLASGSYTLERTEEVLYSSSTPTELAGNCSAADFDMSGATQTEVDAPLTDGVSCF